MDINLLTPDQLASLKQQLGMTDAPGRSPFRSRQLHDLRLAPTATDPRPMFVWSAEGDRNLPVGVGTEFPRLMWHTDSGKEITVYSREEQDEKSVEYTHIPPTTTAMDPIETLSDALADLTEQEREVILKAQEQQRRKALEDQIAALTPQQLDKLLAQATKPSKRARKTA